jgi:hypothetical protein
MGMKHAAALLLLLTACDNAPWTADQIRQPPERYQGNGAYLYREATPDELAKLCKSDLSVACAIGGHVVGPNSCAPEFRGERFSALHCHEKGHVKGWPADHPE